MGEQLLGPSLLLEGLATIITDDEANKSANRNAPSEIQGIRTNVKRTFHTALGTSQLGGERAYEDRLRKDRSAR
jgi:hypothetical protein